jgi:hypothetical protein
VARAAIGAAAKTKTASVRVTAADFQKFQQRFGGLGKFLKMQVTDQLAKWRDEEEK